MTPPPVLDSAQVLEYAVVDPSVAFTGRLHLTAGGRRVGAVPHLAICQDLQTDDLMLFHCDAAWGVIGVQAWNGPAAEPASSVQDVKERAENYYEGLLPKWRVHTATREEALAYQEEQFGRKRCSFCNRTMHEIRFLVHGNGEARICDLCVRKLHGEIGRNGT